MAKKIPVEQFITETVNAAPGGKITHVELATQLRLAGYIGWGNILQKMFQSKQIGGSVEVVDGAGVLTYTPKEGR